MFPLLARDRECRDVARAALAEAGVETRSYFVPLHRQRHLRRYATGECPVADELSARGFYLPLYPGLTEEEVEYVIEATRAAFDSQAGEWRQRWEK